MNKFIVMVGISGSGKSTRAKECYPNATIVSSDEIRERVFGDVNDQTHNGKVFDIMFQDCVTALKAGNDVVYDATNLSSKRRKALLKNMKTAVGCDLNFIAHVVVTIYENCLDRNSNRERKVPNEVIKRQFLSFQVPTEMEGFNDIIIDNTDDPAQRMNYICQKMGEMSRMAHDNPHHPDTVFEHCTNVMSTMVKRCPPYIPTDFIGQLGFYHDIGKLYTKSFDEKGVAHFYSHDAPSAYNFLIQPAAGLNDYCRIAGAAIIGWHMREYSYQSEAKYDEWLDTLMPIYRELLMLLNSADRVNSVS